MPGSSSLVWIADSFNINTWMISSSNIVDGLSWWQSWICVWIGTLNPDWHAIHACMSLRPIGSVFGAFVSSCECYALRQLNRLWPSVFIQSLIEADRISL